MAENMQSKGGTMAQSGTPLACMFQLLEDYQTTGQYSIPIATKI